MRLRKRWSAGAVLAMSTCLAPAHAAIVSELEPNNTLATAQLISDPGSSQTVITGERSFADPSDDFFRFMVSGSTLLRITASSTDAFADSVMGLFGPGGNLLASNDDAGGTFLSALTFAIGASEGGMYTLGFSGFNAGLLACGGGVTSCYDTDDDFVFDTFVAGGGEGGSTGWSYSIAIDRVSAVPEPGSYMLLLAGGLGALPWLRRKPKDAKLAAGGAQ